MEMNYMINKFLGFYVFQYMLEQLIIFKKIIHILKFD